MKLKASLLLALALCWPRPAAAQLDPLLFVKRAAAAQPNVLIAVDTSNRMQRDANGDYIDDNIYKKLGGSSATWEAALGITGSNTSQYYRRKYVGLLHEDQSVSSDKFDADHIAIVGDLESGYATFDQASRINIARRSLEDAIARNTGVARFGLLRTRQSNPRFDTPVSNGANKWKINEAPVRTTSTDAAWVAQTTTGDASSNKWQITRPIVDAVNGSLTTTGRLVLATATGANNTILSILGLATGATSGSGSSQLNSLLPAGRDAFNYVDAPVEKMLDDIKADATTLLSDPNCRNTVAILVVGGGEGQSTNGNPASKASAFLNVSGGHRVPIYVIAIAPPAGDVAQLQAIATNSGGVYTEITAAMVAAVKPGKPVPEFVRAVNRAIQHTFVAQSDFDTAPTMALPTGPYTESQVTSPLVGTVNLAGASDINGSALPETDITNPQTGVAIPQRSNLTVTSGFSLPGFDGKLRGFRTYKPVVDATKPSGYKYVQDGTRLWVASAPAAASRNIYTALPDGTVVAFTTANAATLQPYLNLTQANATDPATFASTLITYVRSLPLGAIVDSTPAIMDAPSVDPPPDTDYPGFAAANADRRSIVWIGANDGMLHAIDARLGKEVWAFIPFNLLPKLYTLMSGQAVGDFRFFVDGSPKVADVKVGGVWRTYLVMGEGPGGTFYQTFDVTLDAIAATAPSTDDDISHVLAYFADPTHVPLKWTFPRYSTFDTTILPYGELGASATSVEKSVGQTWSDPAVGQIEGPAGKYAVLTGSGFFKYSLQQSARGGAVAGTTFYLLDAATGAVFDSRTVTSDAYGETDDSCVTANDCSRQKNALQADPVATGPPDSRFITKAYIGDLDGKIWRFDIGLNVSGVPEIKAMVNLYTITISNQVPARSQPVYSSMATVNVGGTQQYLFVGTGSDLLPSNGVTAAYNLLVVLDNGSTGSKTASIALALTKSGSTITGLEKVTAFPAVAGDIVFFSTTTFKPTTYCGSTMDANLYAFTFIGGPAYDTNGDGKLTTTGNNKDTPKVFTSAGARATSPFIVDQHVALGAGGKVEMFGDSQDYNNGVGQAGVRILTWREVR